MTNRPRTGIRRFAAVLAGAALALGACASGPNPNEAGRLFWMTGCWQSVDGQNRETWSTPLGGVMFGHAGTTQNGVLSFFEQSRIDLRQPRAVYTVSPNGQRATEFVENPAAATIGGSAPNPLEVVFENPQHDYPQRIAYRRGPNQSLAATVSLLDGGRPVEYAWNRCRS